MIRGKAKETDLQEELSQESHPSGAPGTKLAQMPDHIPATVEIIKFLRFEWYIGDADGFLS